MKTKSIYIPFLLMILLILAGCSGGGGSGTGTAGYGTITMDITDAKPFIEGGQPDELWLVIEEVLIHQSGGGWISLDLPAYPFEINLLAFYDGMKARLVPPSPIPVGDITQFRMVISRAYMIDPDDGVTEIDLDVPSGKLRTDKKCEWSMGNDDALRITIHFDLSQSIVQTGPGVYKLKPVFHLFDDELIQAATITGNIDASSFIEDTLNVPTVDATVYFNVTGLDVDETSIYTKVWIEKFSDDDPTEFTIYWLVPLASNNEGTESYMIEITNGFDTYTKLIEYPELHDGDEYLLENLDPIILATPPPEP